MNLYTNVTTHDYTNVYKALVYIYNNVHQKAYWGGLKKVAISLKFRKRFGQSQREKQNII